MGYLVLFGLLMLVAAIAAALILGGAVRFGRGVEARAYRSQPLVAVGVAFVLLLGLATLFASYQQIDSGHVGIVRTFGEISGQIGEGPNWIAPWQQVQQENIQVRKAEFRNPRDDVRTEEEREVALGRIDAASFETQDVYFDVTLNYQIDPTRVQDLFRNVGPQWFSVLVPNRVQQFFKAEAVRYPAIEATQKREEIRRIVAEKLGDELAPFGVHIVSLQIENVAYRPAFSDAIEAKQVATQDALREEEVVRVNEAQARQNEATARGEAAREIAVAEGNARATVLRGNAQAEANRAVAASLTPELVQYAALDKLEGVSLALVPADGTTLLDPTGILRRAAGTPAP